MVILPLAKIKSHLSVFNGAVLYIMVDQIFTFSGKNESVALITTVLWCLLQHMIVLGDCLLA